MESFYRKPGVYFDPRQVRVSGRPDILPRMDIPAFVGIAERGPLNKAVCVESWSDFRSVFGRRLPDAYLAHAVHGFFANRGKTCWIIRVADERSARTASLVLLASGRIESDRGCDDGATAGNGIVMIEASSPGNWGNDIAIEVVYRGNDLFDLNCALSGGYKESWHRLSFNVPVGEDGSVVNILNRSRLIRARLLHSPEELIATEKIELDGASLRFGNEIARWLSVEGERTLPLLPLTADIEQKILMREPLVWPNRFSANLRHGEDGLAPTVRLKARFGSGIVSNEFLYLHQRSDAQHFDSVSVTLGDATPPPGNTVDPGADSFDLTVTTTRRSRRGFATAHRGRKTVETETFRGLSPDPDSARYIVNVINDARDGSRIVVARDVRWNFQRDLRLLRETYVMQGGLGIRSFSGVENAAQPFELLDPGQAKGMLITANIPEVTMIAAPDIMPKFLSKPVPMGTDCSCIATSSRTPPEPELQKRLNAPNFTHDEIAYLQGVLIKICNLTRDRFALLDMPLDDRDGEGVPHAPAREALAWRQRFESSYAALYAPWIVVADHDELPDDAHCVPPSGHMAGIYARLDGEAALWKSPANERLENAIAVSDTYSNEMLGDLTADGVNVICFDPSGMRISAARTLSYDRNYRYVGVRRMAQLVERGLRTEGMTEAFEPNDHRLWRDIDRLTRSFLSTLFDRGMLVGGTREEAFFVRCDETTNTPDRIDRAMVVCVLGLRLAPPAEFITMRLGRTEDSTILLN